MLVALLVTVVLLLSYAAGIFILLAGIKESRLVLGARSWPTTDAFLEKCVVERAPGGGSGITYHVRVKYAYMLAGVRYPGDTLAIGYCASSQRHAHELARQRVMEMDRFVIRYHPDKPELSTIFASENSLVFGMVVFALFWLTLITCFTSIALIVSGIGPAMLAWFR